MLAVTDARKTFGDTPVLRGIELAVARGETLAVLGPSGCGKSTLLRAILGLTLLDAGTVTIDGDRLTPGNTQELRQRCGYVIQGGGLFPHLTAAANARLPAELAAWDAAAIAERLETLRVLTDLPADALTRRPAELSGGQRQRVALMRALFLRPGLLLLDEPLGALDPMLRADLQAELASIIAAEACAAVLVTHDLREAAVLGDRVLLMREGVIEQEGPPADLLDRPATDFARRFTASQRVS